MNNTFAIILLVLLALLFIFMFKTLISAFSSYIKNLPKGIFVILFLAIILIMAYLIYFLITTNTNHGDTGNAAETVSGQTEDVASVTTDNCIILRGDQIWIGDQMVDSDGAKQYLDIFPSDDQKLIIVDDYSLNSLHNSITELCRERGIEYVEKEETSYQE